MKIYLAGPDVFFPQPEHINQLKRKYVLDSGHVPLSPLDTMSDNPVEIYQANLDHIRHSDTIIANLMSWRGTEPDAGTVFEVGYAIALGKKVYAYGIPRAPYIDQVSCGAKFDSDGNIVEDFYLRANLMVALSVSIHDCFFDCVDAICVDAINGEKDD